MTEMQVNVCKAYGQKIFNDINNLLKSKNANGREIYLIQNVDTIPASNASGSNLTVSKITDQINDTLVVKMSVSQPGYTFGCVVNMTDDTVKLPLHLSTVIGLQSTFGLIHSNLLQPDLPGQVIVVSGDRSVINESTEIMLHPADIVMFVIVVLAENTDEAYAELTFGRCRRNRKNDMSNMWIYGILLILIISIILFTVFMRD